MSSIYILEPPTTGKVLLKTTVGDIDIELWTKEAPKTCRNFIQLCLEGYYDNTIFHRVIKGFIAQGGDPNGDGTGGESIYGEPFKDEFHQRLKFVRRGLVAMANAGKNDNGSQFFFTLGATPELQNKHTIFGKVTGETIFNMLRLEEGLIEDERPVYPHKIIKTEVLHNHFSDIEPRVVKKDNNLEEKKKKKEKKSGVKNFKLLSFGEEAEEDEEEVIKENAKFAGKGKSTHDILDDPKLSSKTEETTNENKNDEDIDEQQPEEEIDPAVQLENIRKKLKRDHKKSGIAPVSTVTSSTEVMDTYTAILEEEKQEERKRKYDEIRKEIDSVKKEYHKNKLKRDQEKIEEIKKVDRNETVQEYINEVDAYKTKKDALPKKGAGREQFTLQLLDKFKKKLQNVKQKLNDADDPEEEKTKIDEDEQWFAHRLTFEEKTPVLAKDANRKDDDWFEIYDPRNALNKRRRGENVEKFKK